MNSTENYDDLVLDFEEEEQENTKTYRLDFDNNTIGGMTDELDALRQAVYLMLSTEADKHIIYSYTYGLSTLDLIGMPNYYVVAVLPDRITETLRQDDRVTDVSDFEFEVIKNKVRVQFVVHSIYGEVNAETEVIY
jgi:hypothetical protein